MVSFSGGQTKPFRGRLQIINTFQPIHFKTRVLLSLINDLAFYLFITNIKKSRDWHSEDKAKKKALKKHIFHQTLRSLKRQTAFQILSFLHLVFLLDRQLHPYGFFATLSYSKHNINVLVFVFFPPMKGLPFEKGNYSKTTMVLI